MLLDSVAFVTEVSVARPFMHVVERTMVRDCQSLGCMRLQKVHVMSAVSMMVQTGGGGTLKR